MCKWVAAALLACATCVCSAEDDLAPTTYDYVLYWMVDYAAQADAMVPAVQSKAEQGYINVDPATVGSSDFNWAKLVAVVDGSKVTVDAVELSNLQAGSATDPIRTDLLASLGSDASKPISSFWVEFYNEGADGSLSLLGWSGSSANAETLEANGMLADFRDDHNHSASFGTPWTPDGFTAVPEPTSGLLLLIGGALLALRRKQRKDVEG